MQSASNLQGTTSRLRVLLWSSSSVLVVVLAGTVLAGTLVVRTSSTSTLYSLVEELVLSSALGYSLSQSTLPVLEYSYLVLVLGFLLVPAVIVLKCCTETSSPHSDSACASTWRLELHAVALAPQNARRPVLRRADMSALDASFRLIAMGAVRAFMILSPHSVGHVRLVTVSSWPTVSAKGT